MMRDGELMQARANALFTYDERGRTVSRNDPERAPAPRLYLGYTRDGYVVRWSRRLSDTLAVRIQSIVAEQPPVEELRPVPRLVTAIEGVLEGSAPTTEGGPAYRFPDSLPAAAETVQITGTTLGLVRDTFPWLLRELADWWPCFAVVQDGAAVSVCFSARIGAAVCEAGVETLPAFRRRGYAAAVTAAWAAAIRESGRVPLYSTFRHNLASQGVAHRLGLIPFGADVIWE